MILAPLIDRLTSGLLLAFTIIAAIGTAILLFGQVVPDWLFWVALAIGMASPRCVQFGPLPENVGRWRILAIALIMLIVLAALVYGALATPSRHWDGAIAWDLKARFLSENPTLDQAFFQNRNVIHHSRDYPLAQPLLLALMERSFGVGRLVMPLGWLMAAGAVLLMSLRRGVSWLVAGLGMVAFACTPLLISPTSGGVDSGYADAALAAWLTIAAAGCVVKDMRWVVCSVILILLTKPEGAVYASLLLGAAWLGGCRSVLRGAALGSSIGMVLLLLLQHELQFADRAPPPMSAVFVSIAVIGLMVFTDLVLARRGLDRWRLRLAVGLAVVVICAMPSLVHASGNPSGSLARYMQDPWLVLQRLESLPLILLRILDFSMLHGWFGLTMPLVALAVWCNRRSCGASAPPAIGVWLALCVPCWCAAFLISDLELAQHLRSRLPRLLLHAVGIAWVYILSTWQARLRPPGESSKILAAA